MAIDGSYRIAEDLSRQGLDFRRQRDSEIGQRLLGVVPTLNAAVKGGPAMASAVAESWRPHHTDPVQFAAEKANLKMKLMKQLQDYESARITGIADIVRAMKGSDNTQAEIFKALLRANGVSPDGISSADRGLAAARAKMSGDLLGFATDALKEAGVNPAGMSRIMESVFQTAQSTNGNWLGAGGPLEMLAQQVMSSIAAGEPEVAYAAITLTAARMGMQDRDLRAILEQNQDNKLFKYLFDQMKEADKWADASGAKLKMVGAAIGFQERVMESLGSEIASDPSIKPDDKQRVQDAIENTKLAAKELGLSTTDGNVSVMDIDRVIDKVEPSKAPMGKDQVLSLLQEIDQWKGNPSLAHRRQEMMRSESFQKFKADLGLKTDEIAFKEMMRRNALQVHQDRQADRSQLRQGTQSSQPFPRPASAGMVSQTASPPAIPAPQGTPPTPATTGQPDGLIEPGNIDLNNRPVVPNGSDYSTVLSMSFGEDGVEILVPMVSGDGRLMTNDEAIEEYHRTRKHLGKFAGPAEATAYAEKLHKEQEAQYAPQVEAPAPVEEGPPLYAIGPDGKPWRLSPDRKDFRPATNEELQAVEEAQRAIDDAGYDDVVIGGPEQYPELENQYKSATAAPAQKPAEQKPAQAPLPVTDVQAPPTPVAAPDVNPMTGKQAVEKPILPGLGQAINDIGFTLAHPSLQAQRAISEIRDGNIFHRDAQKPKRVKKKRNPFTEDFDTTGLGDFTATP